MTINELDTINIDQHKNILHPTNTQPKEPNSKLANSFSSKDLDKDFLSKFLKGNIFNNCTFNF